MKQMFESKEAFTAYATIDAGYFMLNEIYKDIPRRTGIEQLIDSQTGYDKYLAGQLAKKVIPILEDLLEAKKFIGAATESTEKFLNAAKGSLKKEAKKQKRK